MLQKMTSFGLMICDGRCDKAWGIQGRPKEQLGEDVDDYVFIGDDELGDAPLPGETSGLSEGGHIKPSATPLTEADSARMNKWCSRQCERSTFVETGKLPIFRDMKSPLPNFHSRWSDMKKQQT